MSWSDLIKGAVNQVKDSGASVAIERWLARELADFGEVISFNINSRARSAELHIMLKGEREKLTVHIDEYDVTCGPDADYVTIRRARASREWVNAVLRRLVIGKKQKIPAQYGSMVKLVLGG